MKRVSVKVDKLRSTVRTDLDQLFYFFIEHDMCEKVKISSVKFLIVYKIHLEKKSAFAVIFRHDGNEGVFWQLIDGCLGSKPS